MSRLPIFIVVCLFLNRLLSPLAQEANFLEDYNLPPGIFPKGLVAYDLNRLTGEFQVNFNDSCRFSVSGSDQFSFKSTITGYVSENNLQELKGIKIKHFFMWSVVAKVNRNGDLIEVIDGFGMKMKFGIHRFLESHQCRESKLETLDSVKNKKARIKEPFSVVF